MMQMNFMKQMIDFQKSTFDNSFQAMVMLQDQTEKTVRSFMDQATWMPEEGRKAIDEWLKSYKHGREDFKKQVEENFKRVEEFFKTESSSST